MIEEKQNRFPMPLVAGVIIVGLLVILLYWLTKPGAQSGAAGGDKPLALGEAEKTYAERIHISDLRMSRSMNMLSQEFTYVSGMLANDGTRVIRDIELTTEFRDQFNQVVLRDTQRPFGTATKAGEPLPAGQRRAFQLTFEHVPADWNREYPTIRVSGLILE
ncbi:MAG: hypothetical protein HY234_03585 [Acidobacteria bacterium]|nr:hypothetical protein [Acidobacteriota bacterium]MBI3662118.1 hypothetical protein [Acidobacteriota bacterium]